MTAGTTGRVTREVVVGGNQEDEAAALQADLTGVVVTASSPCG